LRDNNKDQHKFTNKLIEETSPYLLQHAHNPVNWHPWGEKALSLSRQHDKPIFLSVGYSACHWCHVMEEESFENEEIADFLNQHFICIKVDREERPDVDDIYMNAVNLMTGSGGWPLSVWLTPDLEPFYGGTYFPPEDRWGRMGFKNLLYRIVDVWQNQRQQLYKSANQITAHLTQLNDVQPNGDSLTSDIWKAAFLTAQRTFDEQHGGFGSAPKFPQAMELSFLMRYYFFSGDKSALDMVEKSLVEMAYGGIYDQLGGGFHRYSTDERWLVPHFEKMLYDNALLTITYLEAYQITKNSFYADVAKTILDYVLSEMTHPQGGFFSSQDADSEGEEGKYYVWQKSEIEAILGKTEADLFNNLYGVSEQGNWESTNILHQRRSAESLAREYQINETELWNQIKHSKRKLFSERSQRVPPLTDDKILTEWNALMVSAFCKGFQVLADKKYLDTDQKTVDFLFKNLYIDGSLLRTFRAGKSQLNGYLSDYAFLVGALIDLYESAFDLTYLEKAIKLNDLLIQKFWDDEQGGFFFTDTNQNQLLVRTRNPYDNAIPSGNSVAVLNLLRLSEFTSDLSLKAKAEQTIKLYLSHIQRSPMGFAQLLSCLDYFWGAPIEIVISGDKNSSTVAEMIKTVHQAYLPIRIIVLAEKEAFAKHDNLAGKLPVVDGKFASNDEANLYICENYTCQKPFKNSTEFMNYYLSLAKKSL